MDWASTHGQQEVKTGTSPIFRDAPAASEAAADVVSARY